MMKIYECADGLLRWYEEGEQPKGAKEYHQAKPAEESKAKAVKPSNKARTVRTK